MPLARIALVVALLAPAATLAASVPAEGKLLCRWACHTHFARVGTQMQKFKCCHRVCRRVPKARYTYRHAPYKYEFSIFGSPTLPQWSPSVARQALPPARNTVTAARPSSSSTSDASGPTVLVVLAAVAAACFGAARLVSWMTAVSQQRSDDRTAQQTISARDLSRRLERDAREADALIAAYAREANRRGSAF